MAPPLSLFPPPLTPNVLSAPPSLRQKTPSAPPPSGDAPQSSAPLPSTPRGSALQMPPPPGTSAHPLGPTIEKRATVAGGSGPASTQPGGATISAKPQIINPKTEVTRFVPTALRVRRDRAGGAGGPERVSRREEEPRHQAAAHPSQPDRPAPPSMKTKDQMYEAFMREMEGLL